MFIFGETHFSISNGSFSFFPQEHKRQRTARKSGIILIFRLSVIFYTRFQCFRQRRGKYFQYSPRRGSVGNSSKQLHEKQKAINTEEKHVHLLLAQHYFFAVHCYAVLRVKIGNMTIVSNRSIPNRIIAYFK